MIGASSTDIRLTGELSVLDPYNLGKVGKAAFVFPAELGKGNEIALQVGDGVLLDKVSLDWSKAACSFDIAVTDGGGQFLTVYSGKAENGGIQVCPFNEKVTASEIKIVITDGHGTLNAVIK